MIEKPPWGLGWAAQLALRRLAGLPELWHCCNCLLGRKSDVKLNGAAPGINRPISRELSKRRHYTHPHEHQHSTKDDKNSGLL